MIYETLEIVMDQITKYLETKPNDDSVLILENIAKQDDASVLRLKDRIAVSLLNMEEESTLRNIPNISFKDGKTIYKNNKVNLNLYVLFAANRTAYDKALVSINNIVEFFQSKKVFTQVNTPFTPTSTIFDELKNLSLSLTSIPQLLSNLIIYGEHSVANRFQAYFTKLASLKLKVTL